jgi:hypothetical protein
MGEFTSPSGIAPLETLSLVITNDPTCLRAVHSCRQSLVSLRIIQFDPGSKLPPIPQVVFPLLKCLEIQNLAGGGNTWPLNWKMPALETYFGGDGSIGHHDISTIKQLCIDQRLEFPSLPKLELLRARRESHVLHYLHLISSDPTIFPKLEQIELEMEGTMSNEVILAARIANVKRLRPILVSARNKYRHLNGAVATYMVRPMFACFLPSS